MKRCGHDEHVGDVNVGQSVARVIIKAVTQSEMNVACAGTKYGKAFVEPLLPGS